MLVFRGSKGYAVEVVELIVGRKLGPRFSINHMDLFLLDFHSSDQRRLLRDGATLLLQEALLHSELPAPVISNRVAVLGTLDQDNVPCMSVAQLQVNPVSTVLVPHGVLLKRDSKLEKFLSYIFLDFGIHALGISAFVSSLALFNDTFRDSFVVLRRKYSLPHKALQMHLNLIQQRKLLLRKWFFPLEHVQLIK